jgi:nucleoside-diphosphate-sugar epimerase
MRITVTGAGGFIGANLVRRLLAEGHDVCAVVRPCGSRSRLSGLDVITAEANILDSNALAGTLREHRPEVIYHLASSTWSAHTAEGEHQEAVRGGMENLLAACESCGPRRLVITGSAAEYGSGVGFDEGSVCRPDTALGSAKLEACKMAGIRAPNLGIECVWLRLFTPYGPFEVASRLVPSAIHAALNRQPLRLRFPHQERDFVAVADVVEAMVRSATSPLPNPGILNICSGEPTRVSSLASLVFACAGATPDWQLAPEASAPSGRETLARSSGINHRAREWLDWSPRLDLTTGIEEAIAWWKENSN